MVVESGAGNVPMSLATRFEVVWRRTGPPFSRAKTDWATGTHDAVVRQSVLPVSVRSVESTDDVPCAAVALVKVQTSGRELEEVLTSATFSNL